MMSMKQERMIRKNQVLTVLQTTGIRKSLFQGWSVEQGQLTQMFRLQEMDRGRLTMGWNQRANRMIEINTTNFIWKVRKEQSKWCANNTRHLPWWELRRMKFMLPVRTNLISWAMWNLTCSYKQMQIGTQMVTPNFHNLLEIRETSWVFKITTDQWGWRILGSFWNHCHK